MLSCACVDAWGVVRGMAFKACFFFFLRSFRVSVVFDDWSNDNVLSDCRFEGSNRLTPWVTGSSDSPQGFKLLSGIFDRTSSTILYKSSFMVKGRDLRLCFVKSCRAVSNETKGLNKGAEDPLFKGTVFAPVSVIGADWKPLRFKSCVVLTVWFSVA